MCVGAEGPVGATGVAGPPGHVEYERLMTQRQNLIDSGVPEGDLLMPIARTQAEVDAQIESVQGPQGRVMRTCENTQCRVETFAPFRGDRDGYCPSCYGSGS